MKGIYRISSLYLLIFALTTIPMRVHAADDMWSGPPGIINWYLFEPAVSDVITIALDTTTNPATCTAGLPGPSTTSTFEFDFSPNQPGMTNEEAQQILNGIYLAAVSKINVMVLIDGSKCSPRGRRLIKSIQLINN